MDVVLDDIREVIENYPPEQRFSLAIMQDLQHKYNYIPREGMEQLSEYLGCPLSSLYSMATFYKATACHIRGSAGLLDGISRLLGIGDGGVTEDGMFSLELVNCLGSCALAPAMLIDENYHGKVTVEKLPSILDSYRKGGGE